MSKTKEIFIEVRPKGISIQAPHIQNNKDAAADLLEETAKKLRANQTSFEALHEVIVEKGDIPK